MGFRLIDRLHGAQYILVEEIADQKAAFVWKGGHGITAYDGNGREMDYWQLGGAENPTEVQVERSILDRISTVWGDEEEEQEAEEETYGDEGDDEEQEEE